MGRLWGLEYRGGGAVVGRLGGRGEGVGELREGVGMGLAELACLSGLDRGFLAILEAGKAVESEVTDGVLMDLATALSEGRDVWTIREYLEEAMRP